MVTLAKENIMFYRDRQNRNNISCSVLHVIIIFGKINYMPYVYGLRRNDNSILFDYSLFL